MTMDDDKKEPSTYTGTIKVNIRGKDYYVHSSAPLPMMNLADLEEGLQRNRLIIQSAQERIRQAFIQEAIEFAAPWQINYDSPIQDAIQAHLNINMLIPLINLKGGQAVFEKLETFPVQQRVELMRNLAERSVFMQELVPYNTINRSLIITLVLMLVLALVLV